MMNLENIINTNDMAVYIKQAIEKGIAEGIANVMRQTPKPALKGETMTLDVLMSEWIETKIDITENTRQKYDSLYRCHISPVFGGMVLTDIEHAMVQKFVNEKLGNCNQDNITKKYSLETIKGAIQSVFKPLMEYAVTYDYILKNPCKGINIPKRDFRNHKKACTEKDVAKLWEFVQPHRLGFTVLLLATTGMRREELLGLKWENVNLKQGIVHIKEVYAKNCQKGCALKDPKTRGSRRHIPLIPEVVELLKAHKASQPKGCKFVVNVKGKNTPMHPDNYSHMLKIWVKKARIRKPLTAHIFRHFAVQSFTRRGYSYSAIAQFTGHTNVDTIRDYYEDLDDYKSPVCKEMIKDMSQMANKLLRKGERVA